MGMRYIKEELERGIIKLGYMDIGEYVNEAVKEKIEKEGGKKDA